jgi:predicted kinase
MAGKIWILCGLPGVGKSTWVKNNIPNAHIISRDQLVESVAAQHGITYDAAFDNTPECAAVQKEVNHLLNKQIEAAGSKDFDHQKDVVIDMTNLTERSRKKNCPHRRGRDVVCVFFNHEGAIDRILNSIKKRSQSLGWKIIPDHVIYSMLNGFQKPNAILENFEKVIVVNPTYLS